MFSRGDGAVFELGLFAPKIVRYVVTSGVQKHLEGLQKRTGSLVSWRETCFQAIV